MIKLNQGVKVKLIINNDTMNIRPGGVPFQHIIDAGGTFHFALSKSLMHHKFCLIDSNIVITGSYNWTYAARKNRENIIITDQADVVHAYKVEFQDLLSNARKISSISDYMRDHPPANYEQNGSVEVANEVDLWIDDGIDSVGNEQLLTVIDYGLSRQPDNDVLKQRKMHAYKRYADSVEELCRRYPGCFCRRSLRTTNGTLKCCCSIRINSIGRMLKKIQMLYGMTPS